MAPADTDVAAGTEPERKGEGGEPKLRKLPKDEQPASNIEFKWRSRDNRKGRHQLLVEPAKDLATAKYLVPESTSSLRAIARGMLRMVTQFPYWDISWLVATIFTMGSVIWVINGFFSYLPLAQPSTEFNDEVLTGGGVTAFIGATVFEIGSVLLMFEAVNANREGCFGWALERVFVGDGAGKGNQHGGASNGGSGGEKIRVTPDKGGCAHHHTNKGNLVGKPKIERAEGDLRKDIIDVGEDEKEDENESETERAWQWFPSLHDLTTHYLRELGFLACLSQFIGATVFWISGFTALPGINNKMSQGLLDGIYWTPQIVGGSGFIVSGTLFMLETQEKWYKPAPRVLGWHIGLWNLIGAIGFTLCGSLGPAYGNSGALYEASLATFWGSWAFLIGSVVQWYESLDKHPVEDVSSKA